MLPQSPKRGGGFPVSYPTTPPNINAMGNVSSTRLRSVFEDDVNMFNVENTPAQFSSATSLSNLSFDHENSNEVLAPVAAISGANSVGNLSIDDEPKIATDSLTKEMRLSHPSEDRDDGVQDQLPSTCDRTHETTITSDSDEADDDNMILATCINIGMNCGVKDSVGQKQTTPSIAGRLVTGGEKSNESSSDSSCSDIGNDMLFEECIRDGIQKSTTSKPKPKLYQQPRMIVTKEPVPIPMEQE